MTIRPNAIRAAMGFPEYSESHSFVTETITVTKITILNRAVLANVVKEDLIHGRSVFIPGNYLVTLTYRIENPIDPGYTWEAYQLFFCAEEADLEKHLVLSDTIRGRYTTTPIRTAVRKPNPTNQTSTFKEESMSRAPMTTSYILYMIDRHGSTTREILMDYGRDSKDIQKTFKKAVKEGYLEVDQDPQKPYLTQAGRDHLRDYYGNGVESYD